MEKSDPKGDIPMKNLLKRTFSLLLILAMVAAMIPAIRPVEAHAVTKNQQNIVDRANFFFNTTWVCQKTIMGWRDEFTFEKGETYRLPYGQPVNSGKFIGYGVTLEDFLAAAADVNSVYYSRQSEFNGWTSAYYATDCAAFVAMCWGTVRQDCSTLPYYSTNMGVVSEANLNKIQLGDALDSTTVGHVVLVTDLKYDENGNTIAFEITEQTPPQLKRTVHTRESLLEKYGDAFYIYRYFGEVPEAPVSGYVAECTAKAAYCDLRIEKNGTPLMSEPCYSTVLATSVQLATAMSGDSFVATRLFENTIGEYWYRVKLGNGSTAYVRSDNTSYQGQILSDIALTNATAPSAHVKGNTFAVNGNVSAINNSLTYASTYIYKGFGIGTTAVTGYKDVVSSNSYNLTNSTIDYNTSFGTISTGQYTYAIAAEYKNYYVDDAGKLAENSGTVTLMEEYFCVVSYAVNQSSCSHSYTTTEVYKPTCTEGGITVKSCATCGLTSKQAVSATGHSYGEWTVDTQATCTADGSRSKVCAACGDTVTEVICSTGHDYDAKNFDTDCQTYAHTIYTCTKCGDSYRIYADEVMSEWQPEVPDVDASLMEQKPQYRYKTRETFTSAETEVEGATQIGSEWGDGKSGTVTYVDSWPSGFDTTNSLYAKYNNIGSKVTASETETDKITVEGESVVGYLYYHWCSNNDYNHYSYANKTNSHTIFHAYYSETNPDSYVCDTSDMSYKTSDSCCANGNSQWFFVVKVKAQKYTAYEKIFTYERWSDWSDWQDEAVEESAECQIEERTVYRYVDSALGEHNYVDNVCTVCGDEIIVEPTLNPTLSPDFATVSFEGEVQMNIYFNATDLGDIAFTDMGLLTWSTSQPDGTIDTAEGVHEGVYFNGTYYVAHTGGIAAKNLGDVIYFKIYARLADGSYIYTNILSTSPKSYAMSILNNPSAEKNIKALCVAMLNYGAAAQTYFGYKTDELMNSDVTLGQVALIKDYDESMMDSLVPVDADKVGEFVRTPDAFTTAYPKVSFEGAFSINYYFQNALDIDDTMTLYYWTAADYANADVLTAENATDVVEMNYDDVLYSAAVPNIAAKEMDSTIYAAAVYTCNGELCTTGIIPYSLGYYCESIAAKDNSDAQDLASHTAVYGYYAKVYFASL